MVATFLLWAYSDKRSSDKERSHHHGRIIDSDHWRGNRDTITQWGHGKIRLHSDDSFDYLLELFCLFLKVNEQKKENFIALEGT